VNLLIYTIVKYWLTYLVTVILLSVVFSLLLWFISPQEQRVSTRPLSPLPDFLTLEKNNQVRILDLWEPIINAFHRGSPPAVTAESVLMYDLATQKTLYEKNSTMKLPMASITKIMTAIIALENKKQDDSYYVKEEYLVGENSMGLTSGEVLTLNELLYGLILPSGNDAAETIAGNFPTGRTGFIKAMNKKVEALGLKDTHFTNPSGLQGDGDQYTTAYDLLVLTEYALENKTFKKVAETVTYEIPETTEHKAYTIQNETNLLTSYPGVKGVKTGYTPEAGLCLVTYLEYSEHKVIGVLLNSENRRQEMKELLDYSLYSLNIKPPKHD